MCGIFQFISQEAFLGYGIDTFNDTFFQYLARQTGSRQFTNIQFVLLGGTCQQQRPTMA